MKRLLLIITLLLVPFFGTSQQPAEMACFSVPGGFYEASPTLEIFPFYQQHHIRFTTNGSRPTAQSQLYTGPLLLDESMYSTSNIYTIQVAPEDFMYYPDSIRHCIVIRAAVFDENDSCISETSTNSYFIHSLGCDTHGLPAISLCADSLDLFDYYRGIMVPGYNYHNYLWSGNYFGSGDEWERPCNVEFYETENRGVNQQAGLRTHGKSARYLQQKGLKVIAREQYGKKRFKHRFFPDTDLDSFKHLVLRPFCSSNGVATGIQDVLAGHFAHPLNIESLAARVSVLFINGEYWGIYVLEETPNQHYLEDHCLVDPDRCNIIKEWIYLDYGESTNWDGFCQWLSNTDCSLDENYAEIQSKIDLGNIIDYYIYELYSHNFDWPVHNVRCWQEGNGPWRFIFFDGDGCFSRDFDVLANATDTSNVESTLLFRKLIKNDSFVNSFMNRFNQLTATHFLTDDIVSYFDMLCGLIEAEVPRQSERFAFPQNLERWETDVNKVRSFIMTLNQVTQAELAGLLHSGVAEQPFTPLVYPNPFSDQLRLCVSSAEAKESELCIMNLLGQTLYRKAVSLAVGENVITLETNLSSGVYLLKLGPYSSKIVCKRNQ